MKVLNKTRNFDKFSQKVNKKELPAAGVVVAVVVVKSI